MSEALVILPDEAAWAARGADALADALQETINDRGQAVLAVAGGTTPGPIFRELAERPLAWRRVAVTLTDERRVPPDAPESNERLVRQTLLTGPVAAAAFAPLEPGPVDRAPDLVLLGMGEDGHVASIFPGSPLAEDLLDADAAPACAAVPAGDGVPPPQPRLSLNLAALTSARLIVLAIRGEAKRRLYERAAAGDVPDLPVARLLAAGAPVLTLWSA